MASRKLFPFLVLACLGSSWLAFAPARPPVDRAARGALSHRSRTVRTVLFASKETEENDAVEVGGFSASLVGLTLLPYIGYAISCAFSVIFANEAFQLGPFGLQFVSVVISFGVALWSIGTFLESGKGLPFGWLGLLGLAEALSYLAALLLGVAAVATSLRAPQEAPQAAFKSSAPSFRSYSTPSAPSGPGIPSFQAPELKMPSIKAPELPTIKAPEIPTFKTPEIPTFKAPEMKVTPSAPRTQTQSSSDLDDLFGSDIVPKQTQKDDGAKKREEAKKAEEERKAEEAKKREEAKKAEEERKAEEAKKREEAKKAEEERKAEEAKKREEAKKAEEERKAEEAKKREEAKKAEEERKAEEAKKREEAKKAEEERKAAEAKKREESEKKATESKEESSGVGSFLADLGRIGRDTKEQPLPEGKKEASPTPSVPSIKYDLFDL